MKVLDYNGAQCHEIRTRLQEIDSGFEIKFDYDSESYHITHNGHPYEVIHYQSIDRDFFQRVRFNIWLNTNGNVFDWVDEQNNALDAAHERRSSYANQCLAEDMWKPLKENYYYGR